MTELSLTLKDEAATENLGAALSSLLRAGDVVYLLGDLGAGKTTLTRGLLRARGHIGACKSPTYTLVESYGLPTGMVHHFDLYRIVHAEELEYLALDEHFTPENLCLVEWPQRGAGVLPKAALTVALAREGSGRRATLTAGRGREEIIDFLSKSILC